MGWVVNATPRPLYPREIPGTPCIGGWVGPRAGLDGCGKSRPPPGSDPRTVQPVASRYTDWAIPAHFYSHRYIILAIYSVVQTLLFLSRKYSEPFISTQYLNASSQFQHGLACWVREQMHTGRSLLLAAVTNITHRRCYSWLLLLLGCLTHWGRVTQICVFTLQLCKTDDANLRF